MLRWNHKMEEKRVFNEVCVSIVFKKDNYACFYFPLGS